jgi:hypothetical protein
MWMNFDNATQLQLRILHYPASDHWLGHQGVGPAGKLFARCLTAPFPTYLQLLLGTCHNAIRITSTFDWHHEKKHINLLAMQTASATRMTVPEIYTLRENTRQMRFGCINPQCVDRTKERASPSQPYTPCFASSSQYARPIPSVAPVTAAQDPYFFSFLIGRMNCLQKKSFKSNPMRHNCMNPRDSDNATRTP